VVKRLEGYDRRSAVSEFRSNIQEVLRKSRTLRRVVRWYRSRTLADPGWDSLLDAESAKWKSALEHARGGPRVLLATSLGGYWAATTLESLLAVALTLRRAKVEVLLCDGILPACQACEARAFSSLERFGRSGPQDSLCGGCFPPGKKLFESLGLTVHRFGQNITLDEVGIAERASSSLPFQEIEKHKLDDVLVGEHAKAGALRFFARGNFDDEICADAVLRRYLKAAILTMFAARRLFSTHSFECAAFHHGIYVPQGLIGEVARQRGVRVVNWNPAYRKKCFIFSHGDTYHHTLLDEPPAAWENMTWTPILEAELLRYLKSRGKGTEDWIWFQRKPREDVRAIARKVGLDLSKPIVGLLTNVIWDAQLHYPANAFRSMMEWLLGTVAYFSKRSDLQLIIRVHPAEVHGTLPSRQKVVDELRKAFSVLPPNVLVVPPESSSSTYALMSCANAAIIYGTKAGVELSAMGIPVIVAGEAWIRNKGFTWDARSAEHYFQLLEQLPFKDSMPPHLVERARKYAYHFFFRRMIPIDCMAPTGSDPPYSMRIRGLEDLLPGRMPGLDVVLNGILEGAPFIYPAEERADLPLAESVEAIAGGR